MLESGAFLDETSHVQRQGDDSVLGDSYVSIDKFVCVFYMYTVINILESKNACHFNIFFEKPSGFWRESKKIGGRPEKSCACRFFVCSAFYAKHASRAAEIAFLSSFWPMMQSFIMRSPTFSSQSFAMSGFWARISFCSFGLAVAIHCPEGPA